MASTFFGLNIAGTGLNAFQASINTTANNISNVRTEGYSKQVTNLSASSALRAFERYGSVGTGVSTDSVTRVRDQYYNEKYWYNQSAYGYYNEKNYYMAQIEEYFKDDSVNVGFSSLFGEMFNSLDSLKTNAGNTSVRNQFVSNGQKLCTYFNNTATMLQNQQSAINDEIKTQIDFINSSANKITILNKQINLVETTGGIANELRDEREKIIDELSEVITIEVEDTPITNSNYPEMYTGATSYTVKVNGQLLVNNYEYNALETVSRAGKYNQSDIEGLYDIEWKESGMSFSVWGADQRGSLRSLFELRDGNDEQNMRGTVAEAKDSVLVIEDPTITDIDNLNLPEQGMVEVNNTKLAYDSWEAELDEEGKITKVTFNTTDPLPNKILETATGRLLTVGQTINYKGIPYYQNQMSSFLRSFTREFNRIEKTGQDLYGNAGIATFVANDVDGEKDFVSDVVDPETEKEVGLKTEYEEAGVTKTKYVLTDSDESYYRLTAANIKIAEAIGYDPRLISTTIKKENNPDNPNADLGIDAADLLPSLLKLEHDTILYRGGSADEFLQCIYADVTVDTQEAQVFTQNHENIKKAIQNQRDSISGVDEDEEAMNLMKFQNAYNLSSKVISVLNEMYNQLILNTGV
ncbi:MAG: flagellar hook-associated protein FlgK [Lachnospiraceae bacterium]|nr:flagellar hook-associated protein FlgK [Lachnospiraceae bacterium]